MSHKGEALFKMWNGIDWIGIDKIIFSFCFSLLQEFTMTQLQERICSLNGSKFFPLRVPYKVTGIFSGGDDSCLSILLHSIPVHVLN